MLWSVLTHWPKASHGLRLNWRNQSSSRLRELDDSLSVSGVGEFELEDFSVVFGLLQPCGGRFVFGLCLDDRDRKVARVAEDVIGAFAWTPPRRAAVNDNAS